MPTASPKIALITGANKGIGLEIARQLGRSNCTVLLGARNEALGKAAVDKLREEDLDAHLINLDLSETATIEAAATRIAADFGHLDILVNNAAIADPGDGAPSTAAVAAIERVFQTNFFATIAVTQAVLPLVRKSTAGRIVNVSSGLGSLTLHSDPTWQYAPFKVLGYSASKSALNMFTIQLAYELRDTPIKVNSADPGYTATDLNHNTGHQTVAEGAAEAIRLALLPPDGPTGTFSDTAGPEPW